ncbi:MAG: hypothetical protein CMC79_02460 [Flavobacteriaceae bacterium]|nr:hypothetical protein [Flavobacteriaceae bacterium]
MNSLFFGYLPIKWKILLRTICFVFIFPSPIIYYLKIEGINLDDVFAMILYSWGWEEFLIWFIIIILVFIISFFFKLVYYNYSNNI